MKKTILVKIITPQDVLLECQATIVNLPGEEGEFAVMPGHMMLLANLRPGIMIVANDNINYRYFIYGGIAEVTDKTVNIVTEFAIDTSIVQKSKIIEKINNILYVLNEEKELITIQASKTELARYESLNRLLQ